MSSRLLLALCLLVFAGCDGCGGGGSTRPTVSEVQLPAVLAFGQVWAREPAVQPLRIQATKTGPVQVKRIGASSAELQVDLAGELKLAPGATVELPVRWLPQQAGALQATLEVETDAENQQRWTVQVTGEAREEPACDDGNPCTDDRYDRTNDACRHAFHTRACDDGSACTEDDRCQEGRCAGRAKACDDANRCTLDLCDPTSGCLHPPDRTQCDDGDPCTEDVCNPAGGCSHPHAQDGTGCGTFDCAEAHLCVQGRCHALDVRTKTDGLPCSDGDLCTEGDSCAAGRCVSGPRKHSAPQVAASFDTYGWLGRGLASDGHRYLFSDFAELQLGVRETDDTLRIVASLPMKSPSQAALFRPGQFVLVSESALVLLDATVAQAPVIRWTLPLAPPPQPTDGVYGAPLRVTGGVLVPFATSTGWDVVRTLLYVELDEASGQPGAQRWIAGVFAGDFLQADGDALVLTGMNSKPQWVRLDLARGAVRETLELSSGRGFFSASIQGWRVALEGNGIDLFEIVPGAVARPQSCGSASPDCAALRPDCAAEHPFAPGFKLLCGAGHAACPAGTACEEISVRDCDSCPCAATRAQAACVVHTAALERVKNVPADAFAVLLDGEHLYFSSADGVWEASTRPGDDARRRIDTTPADALARAPEHVLTLAPLALPLRRRPAGDFVRVTGVGHGELTAVTDGTGGGVRLGGHNAVAELDLQSRRFTSWTLQQGPTWGTTVLRGATRDALVDGRVYSATLDQTDPVCPSRPIRILSPDSTPAEVSACGLFDGPFDIQQGVLWSAAATSPQRNANRLLPRAVRTWSFTPFDPMPLATHATFDADETYEEVRAADGGGPVAVLSRRLSPSDQLRVRLFGAGAPYRMDVPHPAGPGGRLAVGVDGTQLLVADRRQVALYDTTALVPLMDSLDVEPLGNSPQTRVPWMANGRAWVHSTVWEQEGPQHALVEIAYDRTTGQLEERGRIPLPYGVDGLYDTGSAAVVTTHGKVLVVEPSCR